MRTNLKYASVLVLVSLVISVLSLYEDVMTVILPSWSYEGVDLYVYVVAVIAVVAVILKVITAVIGLRALGKYVYENTTVKRLKIAEKFAIALVVSGLAPAFIKLYYGSGFSIFAMFDLPFTIIAGLVFIFCSMYVRAECMANMADN